MKKYKDLKKQLLKNRQTSQEYERLEVEFLIKRKIIDLRLKQKLSQKDLAEKIGTTQSAIARFENEEVNPTMDFLYRLSNALGKKLIIDFC